MLSVKVHAVSKLKYMYTFTFQSFLKYGYMVIFGFCVMEQNFASRESVHIKFIKCSYNIIFCLCV